MKIILNQFTKISGLLMSVVISVTLTVFSFSGNWLKSLAIFAIILPITYFLGNFVIYLAGKIFPFGKNKNKTTTVSKKQIWRMTVVGAIVFPVILGIVFLFDDTDYKVDFTRIIVAIVLSFVAAVIANLLFVKEFCKGNKEIEN